jgi:nitrate/TMAO reductase-like tetraheme cytochrome c subunit
MSRLRGLWQRLRSISARQWAFAGGTVVVLFLALMGVIYAWDYTNSPSFCGTTCHTMPPEYSAWQRSPHARVSCVECHIGRDIITTTFTRKAGDLMHVVRYSSGQFTFPLYAESMIPARESCERCHWPEKFANDRSIIVKRYQDDFKNTLISTYLLMKTGGGTQREGLGKGIHWHIENDVEFIATDELKQNIPWIQVKDSKGNLTTYTDVENPLTPDEIKKAEKRRMDCIDCHNRISHTFRSPEQAVDSALALQQIDAGIPIIKKNAVDVLSASYRSFDDANKAIEELDVYYQKNYADYYQNHAQKIKTAINYLKATYQSLVFPSQDLSWTTHPDDIGHKDSPGCFRCHDGKHFTSDNKDAIRLECNICHTLPEVGTPGGPAPVISMVKPEEPESHRATTWLAQHRTAFNVTCQQCHDTNNAGGKDNSSFCSNSACHGQEWRYAGLNALGLAKIFPPPVPPGPNPNAPPKEIPHPIGGNPDCQICHSQGSKIRPYPSDHIGRKNDVCLACHKPVLPPPATTPSTASSTSTNVDAAGGPPPVPHDMAGRTQCLGCHGSGAAGVSQVPQFHKDAGLGNDKCLTCHKPAVAAQPAVTSSPTPQPKVTGVPTNAPTTASPPTATPQAKATAPAILAPATSAPAASGPSRLPADHVGRTTCTACHGAGIGPKLPVDHAGRTDDTCKMCHQGP